MKEILRVRIAFDKKKQNLEEQIRNPTAFKEGHELLKKLITILIEDQTLIYHCVEMEIFYFFTSRKNEKTLLNEFEEKFKPISSSFSSIFLKLLAKMCVIKRVQVTYNEAPRNKKNKDEKNPTNTKVRIENFINLSEDYKINTQPTIPNSIIAILTTLLKEVVGQFNKEACMLYKYTLFGGIVNVSNEQSVYESKKSLNESPNRLDNTNISDLDNLSSTRTRFNTINDEHYIIGPTVILDLLMKHVLLRYPILLHSPGIAGPARVRRARRRAAAPLRGA